LSGSSAYGRDPGQVVGAAEKRPPRCSPAGALRPDIDPEDVLWALRGAWSVADAADGCARAGRLLDLLMIGLRHGVSTPKTD
jgi:hypothetical protein